MSIVTLKRKTASQYNNMSVSHSGFSLNGTHRSQGYVGQTSLSRSLPRTLMRGNTPRGHGGCCGTFPIGHIVTEGTGLGTNTLNDNKVVKSSVLDTNGMMMTKYRWIRRPRPYTSVKPDATIHNNTGGEYIHFVRRRALNNQCSETKTASVNTNQECCPYMTRHYHHYDSVARGYTISKPPIPTLTTYDDYMNQKDIKCIDFTNDEVPSNNKTFHPFPKNTQGTPFSCGIVNPNKAHNDISMLDSII